MSEVNGSGREAAKSMRGKKKRRRRKGEHACRRKRRRRRRAATAAVTRMNVNKLPSTKRIYFANDCLMKNALFA